MLRCKLTKGRCKLTKGNWHNKEIKFIIMIKI